MWGGGRGVSPTEPITRLVFKNYVFFIFYYLDFQTLRVGGSHRIATPSLDPRKLLIDILLFAWSRYLSSLHEIKRCVLVGPEVIKLFHAQLK